MPSQVNTGKPRWPALISHHEDHELVVVANEEDWHQDAQLSRFPYADEDRLIDSDGWLFHPIYDSAHGRVSLLPLQQQISLDAFTRLLRKHLCTLENCCISKITLRSYREGFGLAMEATDARDK